MHFNTSKCHVLSAIKRSHHHQYFYELCSVVLKSVESEKYLGMPLSSDLSWSSHITAICTKANQKLGFVKRNLKGTPRELKRLAYVAFVRSGMEYASIIWDPHFIKDSDALERVQRRADHWITSKHDQGTSVTALLHQLYLEPLEERRRISRLTFLYKILNEHVAVPMNQLHLVLCDRPVRRSTTKQRLKIRHCASNQFQKSFAARTVTEWNSSPDSITLFALVSSFRSHLSCYFMPVGVHTPLPKYPSGDWQLLSRFRSSGMQNAESKMWNPRMWKYLQNGL